MLRSAAVLCLGLVVIVRAASGDSSISQPGSSGRTVVVSPETSDSAPVDIVTTVPVYPILTADEPPVIDGKLDDAVWQTAPRLGRLHLDTGYGPMKFDTIARFARDATYVYLAVDCRHPKIRDVPVQLGTRDKVSWVGETIELFLDTARGDLAYMQVIFDMSGAFTDQFAGKAGFNADITAATEIGGSGWRLEVRLKIADLGGDGAADPFLWGANIARNTRGQSGSWAKLVGSYHQPGSFGLLTLARKQIVVEDLGLGLFGRPSAEDTHMPIRIRLANRSGRDRVVEVRCEPIPDDAVEVGSVTDGVTAVLTVPATGNSRLARVLATSGLAAISVAVSEQGSTKPLFRGTLGVARRTGSIDDSAKPMVVCAIYPLRPTILSPEHAAAYFMAQSTVDKAIEWSGRLALRKTGTADAIWSVPVTVRLPGYGSATKRIALPAERLTPGEYELDWVPATATLGAGVSSRILYEPGLRKRISKLASHTDAASLFSQLQCPLPIDGRDAAIVRYKIDHLAAMLVREKQDIELDLTGDIIETYRRVMDIVHTLRTSGRYIANKRGWFEAAVISTVDDSAQPFSLFVPYDYDPAGKIQYRLVVKLHGGGVTHGGELGFPNPPMEDGFILHPLARGGGSGYSGVPGHDVIQEIRTVLAHYRIDPDAVHLYGGSMGGGGVLSVGATYPDMFATCKPLCGWAQRFPVMQMVNVPTFVHHGLDDKSVSPADSILAAARMRHVGCPVQLYLHPDVTHSVGGVADETTTWDSIKNIRRNRDPRTVVLSGGVPMLKKAYWLEIGRYADPHADAYVRATFVAQNHLNIRAVNAACLRISLPTRWIDPSVPLHITTDKGYRWTQITAGSAHSVYVEIDGDTLSASTTAPPDVNDPTAYVGGGAARMFWEGRAVRIVYGTGGSADQAKALERLAGELRRWGGLDARDFEVGGYPAIKDTDVDMEMLKSYDLILLGTPAENALVARLADKLPVRFAGEQVVVETEPSLSWPAESVCHSLYYRNPVAPARRIWWFAGVYDRASFVDQLANVTKHRAFKPMPDLVVARRSPFAVIATATVQPDWTLSRARPHTPAKDRWATSAEFYAQAASVIKDALPVDVSLANPSPPLIEPEHISWDDLTVAEALALIHRRPLLILRSNGKQLLAWRQTVGATGSDPDDAWCGPSPETIDQMATYRVLVDVDSAMSLTGEWAEAVAGRYVPPSEFPAVNEFMLKPRRK